jgi:hypothetical protein
MHPNCFEVRGAIRIRIVFNNIMRNLNDVIVCHFFTFLQVVPSFACLKGKGGHKETMIWLGRFLFGNWEKFQVEQLLHA